MLEVLQSCPTLMLLFLDGFVRSGVRFWCLSNLLLMFFEDESAEKKQLDCCAVVTDFPPQSHTTPHAVCGRKQQSRSGVFTLTLSLFPSL